MTRGKIITISTALFYLLLIVIAIVIDSGSPTGLCGPSTGMMLLLSIPVFAGVGLFLSLGVLAGGHRSAKGPTVVNGTVLLAFFLFLACTCWFH